MEECFWDFVIRRFHLAVVGILPRGWTFVDEAMQNAFHPFMAEGQPSAFFVCSPTGPCGGPPVVTACSLQLLAVDCRTTAVGNRARALLGWGRDDATLDSREAPLTSGLRSAELDVAARITQARLLSDRDPAGAPPTPETFELAMSAPLLPPTRKQLEIGEEVRNYYSPQISCFLLRAIHSRPSIEEFMVAWEEGCRACWLRYLRGRKPPEDFGFDCFVDAVRFALAPPHGPPRRVEDGDEQLFLECARSGLRQTDRVALFLLLYAGLNIRQIKRVLGAALGSPWPRAGSGEDAWVDAMEHITDRWIDVIDRMKECRGGGASHN
jgi:hypothetical protein